MNVRNCLLVGRQFFFESYIKIWMFFKIRFYAINYRLNGEGIILMMQLDLKDIIFYNRISDLL